MAATAGKRTSAPKEVVFNLSPTQLRFALSRAMITVIYGGMGGGKSYATAAKIVAHAVRNKEERGIQEVRGCIVRDTLPNIKRSPVPTLQKAFGPLIQFKDQYKEAVIFTDPPIFIDCFGIADLGDLSKLQGPEYAFIWLVEPAPIADTERYSGGIPEEVYNIALARCARQEEAIPLLTIDMNPADEDHWTFKRLIEIPDGPDPDEPLIIKETFRLPVDENVHLQEIAKQAVRVAYRNDPTSLTRFVKGEFATIYHGKKVVEAFSRERHVAKEVLQPLKGFPGVRFWDSWGEPRCVLGQYLPNGQIRVYDVVMDHTDIDAILPKVKHALNQPRWRNAMIREWRDIGDCTMNVHDQSSKYTVTSRKIEDALETTFEPGPQKWDSLKSALGQAFRASTSEGWPAVLICPTQKALIAGLDGPWHYKTDASHNVMKSKPEKTPASHSCDALANGIAVLMPWQPAAKGTESLKKLQAKQRQRARSYGQARVLHA